MASRTAAKLLKEYAEIRAWLDGDDWDGTPTTEKKLFKLITEKEARISKIDLIGADLSGVELIDANLQRIDLMGANLRGAILFDANFSLSTLEGAVFDGAFLAGSDFTKANLTEASMEGADLTDADLTAADLTNANMSEANLKGAAISKIVRKGTDWSGTIFPNGKVRFRDSRWDIFGGSEPLSRKSKSRLKRRSGSS